MLSISPCHSDSNARTVPRASPPGKISSTPRWTARTAGRNSWSRHHRISSCLLISSNSSARTAVGSSLRPPNNLGPRCPAPSRTAVNRSGSLNRSGETSGTVRGSPYSSGAAQHEMSGYLDLVLHFYKPENRGRADPTVFK